MRFFQAQIERLVYIVTYARVQKSYARKWGLEKANRQSDREPLNGKPKLTAIVRIQNEDYWIELILRTLAKIGDDLQIIVVDSGSTDKTKAILRALQKEVGLKIQVFEHEERWVSNPINNLIIERVAQASYFFVVDGDDIQIEGSVRRLISACERDPSVLRYCMHYRHFAEGDVQRFSCKGAESVKYIIGRAFRKDAIRFSRFNPLDSLEGRKKIQEKLSNLIYSRDNLTTRSEFVSNAYVLHAALLRRSSLADWSGYRSMSKYPELAKNHSKVRSRYAAADSDIVVTDVFPKEILELQYSAHNRQLEVLMRLPRVRLI